MVVPTGGEAFILDADFECRLIFEQAQCGPAENAEVRVGVALADGTLKNQDWNSPAMNSTADGALYVTIRDMIAWDKGIREKAVLKPESWKQIFTPVTLKSGKTYPYGFGWFVDEDRGQLRHHHGGAWQGFKTYISRYLGDDLTIILLTNLGNAEPDVFTDAIAAVIDPKLACRSNPCRTKSPPLPGACENCSTKPAPERLPSRISPTCRQATSPAWPRCTRSCWRRSASRKPCGWSSATSAATTAGIAGVRRSRVRPLEITLSLAPDDRLTGFFVKAISE